MHFNYPEPQRTTDSIVLYNYAELCHKQNSVSSTFTAWGGLIHSLMSTFTKYPPLHATEMACEYMGWLVMRSEGQWWSGSVSDG